MAEVSWPDPADGRVVDDRQYELLAARFSDDGLYGRHSDPAPVYADGTGMHVKVRAGLYGSVRGHGWTSGDEDLTLSIGSNGSGQTRTDLVVLRLDRSTWTVRAAVRQGTPGAGPPDLVQQEGATGLWEIRLAQVTVPSGATAITAGNVTAQPLRVGTRVRVQHSAWRNPRPVSGEIAYEHDTGRWVGWRGTTWTPLGPISYESAQVAASGSTQSGWETLATSTWVTRWGGAVLLRLGSFRRTGAAISTESRLPGLIPASYRHPNLTLRTAVMIGNSGIGHVTVYPANHERAGQMWMTLGSISTGVVLQGTDMHWVLPGVM
ncbi:hypothetical protein [uncultured Thermomonospora sp.]|uniref:hypothetical protein n=1 Tax=uncultured Thermomonospora sp. TaxID=671175 RepID=UPI00259B3EB3|nr:hypothetical protein [uncultured Thermomonospora sp.]